MMRSSSTDPLAVARCTHCGGSFEIEHIRLGTRVQCRACHQSIVADVPIGGTIPETVWHLSYHDFLRLIADTTSRPEIQPLLEQWFGYRIADQGQDVLILNGADEAIDPVWLHLKIQRDAEQQYRFYQTAMTLWR
jgi:hypothetical protein